MIYSVNTLRYSATGSGVFADGGPPPSFGGGGGGVAFAAGAKSSSLLFCSPSLKYSSKALLGEMAWRLPLAPRGGAGGAALNFGGGGGAVMAAGMRKSDGSCAGGGSLAVLLIGKDGDCAEASLLSSLLKRAVSNSVSPGAAGGSVKGGGRRCNAPNPRTQPSAPSPPQLRDGVIVTILVTAYS